jgi:hypothetical protein
MRGESASDWIALGVDAVAKMGHISSKSPLCGPFRLAILLGSSPMRHHVHQIRESR